ncbi:hypothetical protein BJX76DRAFT_348696 [Aspergillus varians]
MEPHQILACIELVIYCTLLAPVAFCTYHYLRKKQTAWLYLNVFTLAKIIGPAIFLALSHQPPPSRSLQIAAQVLYQIALGPLLAAALSFANTSSKPNDATPRFPLGQTTNRTPLKLLLRLIQPIIIVGLVLGIVSGVDRAPTSSGLVDEDKYDRGVTLSKVSAALFFVALAGITLGVALLWKERKSLPTVLYYITTCMVVALPCLLLPVVYSVGGAANARSAMDAAQPSRFDILRGDWVIYFFLGFLPQLLVLGVYTACGCLAWVQERGMR